MGRRARFGLWIVLTTFAAFLASPRVHAVPIWATWASSDSTSATGSFPDGRMVQFSGFVALIFPAGGRYLATPAIAGEPSGENTPHIGALTGVPHPTTINAGDLILSVDLTGFPVDAETAFGLADVFFSYHLELLDGSMNPLPLAAVQLSQHNLTYPSLGNLVADYDITLNATTGALGLNQVHDAGSGSTYDQSALTIFTNLPSQTRFIRVVSDAQQATEGIQFLFGGSAVPEPGTTALLFAAALGGLRRRVPRARANERRARA